MRRRLSARSNVPPASEGGGGASPRSAAAQRLRERLYLRVRLREDRRSVLLRELQPYTRLEREEVERIALVVAGDDARDLHDVGEIGAYAVHDAREIAIALRGRRLCRRKAPRLDDRFADRPVPGVL